MLISDAAALAMAITALGMALTPGPNMMYLLSRSISQGRAAGLISLAGTGVGFAVYMTMANVGLTAIFVTVPWLYLGLKVAGVVYLGYLAWQALKPGGRGMFDARELTPDSRSKLFRMGLVTNLLNPKAAIMYLALIPQFINPVGEHEPARVHTRRASNIGQPHRQRSAGDRGRIRRALCANSSVVGNMATADHRHISRSCCGVAGS